MGSPNGRRCRPAHRKQFLPTPQATGGLALSGNTETQELEALGAAINRVCGVLGAVGELYSPNEDAFSGGNAFAAHAVTTAHGLLVEANYALNALYARLLERAAQEAQTAASRAAEEDRLAQERSQTTANAIAIAETQARGALRSQRQAQNHRTETGEADPLPDSKPEGSHTAELAETEAVDWLRINHHADADQQAPAATPPDSGFAETYQELLRRVTAVEIFANNEDLKSLPEARLRLLPLVESLREELSKLNRVA